MNSELKTFVLKYLQKIGHKPSLEWKDGPAPDIYTRYDNECVHCKKNIVIQQSLVLSSDNKIHNRWEIIVGNKVISYTDEALERVTSLYEDKKIILCRRLSSML